MRCYRKILRISCTDHVTDEEVCAKIQQALGVHQETHTEMVWTCLPFIKSGQNHLARQSEKAEEHTADNNNKKRDGNREDNIREWTGL